MKKRITAVLATLCMMVAMMFTVAAPANAYSTNLDCVSYDGVTTCARVNWIRDGGRLYVTNVSMSTTNCGKLLSPPYGNVRARAANDMGNILWYREEATTGCSVSYPTYISGPQFTTVDLQAIARRDGTDRRIYWRWRISNIGGFTLQDKYVTNA